MIRRRQRPSIWWHAAGCLGRLIAYLIGLAVILALVLLVFVQVRWHPTYNRPVLDLTAPGEAQVVSRGEYIVKYAAQCWQCHGAPEAVDQRENAPLSGGRTIDLSTLGPGYGTFPMGLGTYTVPNITPDPDTGIGRWTDGEVVRALREGIGRDGHMLFPIMPYEWLHSLSDEDALAVVAYLRSRPPVRNLPPPSRPSLAARALLAFDVIQPQAPISGTVPAPPPGPTAAYGGYLANQVAMCSACHTPRDPQTWQPLLDRPFAGSLFPIPVPSPPPPLPPGLEGGGAEGEGGPLYAPNLTPDPEAGIGRWSEADFIRAMRQGVTPEGRTLRPAMPWPWYAQMSDDDLRAIYLYLRSLP